jgi:nucleolar protein 53
VSSSCSNYQNNIMPAVRSTTAAKFKASEARGKAKAPVASTSAIGAPAQYKQTNRKGKKAWRKNIDIQSEEQALEKVREIEQALGYVAFFTYREP